jgi:hypothetical protein
MNYPTFAQRCRRFIPSGVVRAASALRKVPTIPGLVAYAHPATGEIWIGWAETTDNGDIKSNIWIRLDDGEAKPGKKAIPQHQIRELHPEELERFLSWQDPPTPTLNPSTTLGNHRCRIWGREWNVEISNPHTTILRHQDGTRTSVLTESFHQSHPQWLS